MPKAFERDDKRILLQQSNTNNFSCIYMNIQDINIELCDPILVLQENVSKKKTTKQNFRGNGEEPSWKGQKQDELFWTTHIITFHCQD